MYANRMQGHTAVILIQTTPKQYLSSVLIENVTTFKIAADPFEMTSIWINIKFCGGSTIYPTDDINC